MFSPSTAPPERIYSAQHDPYPQTKTARGVKEWPRCFGPRSSGTHAATRRILDMMRSTTTPSAGAHRQPTNRFFQPPSAPNVEARPSVDGSVNLTVAG